VFALILLGTVLGADTYELGSLDILLAALACGSLALRRRFPWAVLAFACTLTAVHIGLHQADGRDPVVLAAAVALYTVAARTDRSTTWTTGLAVCVGLTTLAMLFGPDPWYRQENLAVFAWTGMAAAAGDAVRSRRAYIAAVEERAERAERSREEEARRRVAEERMRIARELHDVVAHHIALVNVQAGVAAHVMDSRPDQAKQALAHVREASRSALDELRATVGLLRQSGEPEAPMEPAPGLGVLDQLLDGFRRAGLHVTVECRGCGEESGRPAPLPASVDLTAYRVIQESLTNVQKHAGPRAGAVVRIIREAAELRVVVDDDGAGGRGAPPGGASGAESGTASGSAESGSGAGSGARPGARSNGRSAVSAEGGPGSRTGGASSRAGGSGSRTGGSGSRAGRVPRPSAAGDAVAASTSGAPDSSGASGSGFPGGSREPLGPAHQDFGPGPAPGEGAFRNPFGGHGLLGMHERASALGGVCRTGARPGGGFRVSVRLPLSAPPRTEPAPGPADGAAS
jgi:signal transduction histidine kinase